MTSRSAGLLALAAAATIAAVALSSSYLGAFDHAVRAIIVMPAEPGARQLEAVRDLTAIGGFPIIVGVTVAALLLFVASGRRRAGLTLLVTVIGATVANFGLKILFAKPRPPADESHIAVFTLSYPSGHALMTGALAGALALLATAPGTRTRAVALGCALVVTLLVGLSRVRLGAHWPTDVIAGWLMATAILALLALRLDARS